MRATTLEAFGKTWFHSAKGLFNAELIVMQ
jgi:hypothetical protein